MRRRSADGSEGGRCRPVSRLMTSLRILRAGPLATLQDEGQVRHVGRRYQRVGADGQERVSGSRRAAQPGRRDGHPSSRRHCAFLSMARCGWHWQAARSRSNTMASPRRVMMFLPWRRAMRVAISPGAAATTAMCGWSVNWPWRRFLGSTSTNVTVGLGAPGRGRLSATGMSLVWADGRRRSAGRLRRLATQAMTPSACSGTDCRSVRR